VTGAVEWFYDVGVDTGALHDKTYVPIRLHMVLDAGRAGR
jgi:hypothetical protein